MSRRKDSGAPEGGQSKKRPFRDFFVNSLFSALDRATAAVPHLPVTQRGSCSAQRSHSQVALSIPLRGYVSQQGGLSAQSRTRSCANTVRHRLFLSS
jgi:hypothetical protein